MGKSAEGDLAPSAAEILTANEEAASRSTGFLRRVGWALVAVPIVIALLFVWRGRDDAEVLSEKLESESARIEQGVEGRLTDAVSGKVNEMEERLRQVVRTEVDAATRERVASELAALAERLEALENGSGAAAGAPAVGQPGREPEALERRLDALSGRVEALEARLDTRPRAVPPPDEKLAHEVETMDGRVDTLESELASVEESLLDEIHEAASAFGRFKTDSVPFKESDRDLVPVQRMSLKLRPGVLVSGQAEDGGRRYFLEGFALLDEADGPVFPAPAGPVELESEHTFSFRGCEHRFIVHLLKERLLGKDRMLLNISRGVCSAPEE